MSLTSNQQARSESSVHPTPRTQKEPDMSPSRFIGAAFGACDRIMAMAMDGLTDEDLMKRLSDQANTIGWLR